MAMGDGETGASGRVAPLANRFRTAWTVGMYESR